MMPVRSTLDCLKLDKEFVANVFSDMISEGWFADQPTRIFKGMVCKRAMLPTCGVKCKLIDAETDQLQISQRLEKIRILELNG